MEEEIKAEVIDDTVLAVRVDFVPATITVDFDGLKRALENRLSIYDGMTDETAAEIDYKDAKKLRADLRSLSKELNARRIEVKKRYSKPLDEFQSKVKELDEMIGAKEQILDRAIKRIEEDEREAKQAQLFAMYEDYAPFISPVVAFDDVCDPKWLNRSFSLKKAEEALYERVDAIAKDWEVLKSKKDALHYYEETEAEFFRSLSLADALRHDEERYSEQQRIAEMKEQVERYSEPVIAPELQAEDFGGSVNYVLHVSMNAMQKSRLMNFMQLNKIHGTIGVENV